jgi:hypothetical protein
VVVVVVIVVVSSKPSRGYQGELGGESSKWKLATSRKCLDSGPKGLGRTVCGGKRASNNSYPSGAMVLVVVVCKSVHQHSK